MAATEAAATTTTTTTEAFTWLGVAVAETALLLGGFLLARVHTIAAHRRTASAPVTGTTTTTRSVSPQERYAIAMPASQHQHPANAKDADVDVEDEYMDSLNCTSSVAEGQEYRESVAAQAHVPTSGLCGTWRAPAWTRQQQHIQPSPVRCRLHLSLTA